MSCLTATDVRNVFGRHDDVLVTKCSRNAFRVTSFKRNGEVSKTIGSLLKAYPQISTVKHIYRTYPVDGAPIWEEVIFSN